MLTMKSASEEILAATIARNELRKQGTSVSQAPEEFLGLFHKFLSVPAGLAPKAARQAEKARVAMMEEYLTVNDKLTLE
jgi:hypothetical protein